MSTGTKNTSRLLALKNLWCASQKLDHSLGKFFCSISSKICAHYTQLVDFQDDEYVCEVAGTIEEVRALVEAGFEYVCDIENTPRQPTLGRIKPYVQPS